MSHTTLIIPYVAWDATHIEVTEGSIKSFAGMFNRLILIQNGGTYPNELWRYADIYIENKVNRLMAGAVNQAYLLASYNRDTEYLVFSNNDITNDPSDPVVVEKLLFENAISSPTIGGQGQERQAHASFFCCHKDVFAKLGLWNPDFGSSADAYWFDKAVAQDVIMRKVDGHVLHDHISMTNKLVDLISEK
jgi:hypothetical protein